ncbi:hypothetical protein SteCoe_547 [Stentor coeruleus]|uniref:Uncharacterized protein n=1 Tax=Stentor coeruleus TaxID=5963 RepID=A0A1R2D3Z9_9CILI|nr:hypothetical protein SteCoe_547 [Stentor coeruleus]
MALFLLGYFKEGFSYNLEHAHANKNIKSKAHPKIDIHNKTFTALLVLLYMFLSDQHYYFYLCIFITLEAFLGFSYLLSFPYYSRVINFLYVYQELGPCLVAIFFAFCLFLENGTVLIVMTIFLLPILGVVVYWIVLTRDDKIVIDEENYIPVENFERMCRNKLLKAKPSKKVVKIIQNYYERFGMKIILVYLANHLNLKHEKNKNALLEISKASYEGSDLFVNFQIYKCQKHLESLNENFSEGLKLKIFIKSLGKIKTLELKLCDKIIFLLGCFQSKISFIKNTKIAICQIHKTLSKLKKKYIKMLEKYPQSEILNEMFGSLHIMLGKYESGSKYIEKSSFLHKENKKKNELLTFLSNKNAHIMLISANKKDFGRVLYLSRSMSIFLSVIQTDSTNHYLKDFIPKVFHDTHYKRMEMSLKDFNDDKLFTNITLFLCDSYGFLVECSLNIDCVGYDSSVTFVVGASPIRNIGRETALITTDGDILNHSQRLPYFLGDYCVSIKGKNIFAYFPWVSCESLLTGIPIFTYVYREDMKKNVKIGLYLQVKEKGTKTYYLLYIIHDESLLSTLNSEIAKNSKPKKFTYILKLEVTEETEDLLPDKSDCPPKTLSSLETNNSEYNIIGSILEIATKKQVDKILKLLKYTKILIIFYFLAAIISNTIIFVALNEEVNHSIDFKAINTIAKANTNLVYISFIARYIYLSHSFNETSVFIYEDLENYLSNLPSIHDVIISNAEEWTYWNSYDIIFKDTLPVYQNSSSTRVAKINLLDLISSTYKYVIYI